jgi:hypothetical protein
LNEISTFIDKVIETLFIEVSDGNRKYIVGSVYRPNSNHPNLTVNDQQNQFLELFSTQAAHLSTYENPVYILGDLNLDLLKYNESNVVKSFFSSLRMVYFTTFVHNSPRLPLYKYQGETGSIQFVTMIVMSLYECGNTRESLQDRHLR